MGSYECCPRIYVLSTSVALWVWWSEDVSIHCSSVSVHWSKSPTQNLGGNNKIEVKSGWFGCIEIRKSWKRTRKSNEPQISWIILLNMRSFCQVQRSFSTFSAVPDSSSDDGVLLEKSEQFSPPVSLRSVSEVDTNMFNVYVAVPGQEENEEKIRFTEHVYTISEEDLASSDSSVEEEEENKEERTQIRNIGRRQFRECQSGCVQSSCLPVRDVATYTECVTECKISCSK